MGLLIGSVVLTFVLVMFGKSACEDLRKSYRSHHTKKEVWLLLGWELLLNLLFLSVVICPLTPLTTVSGLLLFPIVWRIWSLNNNFLKIDLNGYLGDMPNFDDLITSVFKSLFISLFGILLFTLVVTLLKNNPIATGLLFIGFIAGFIALNTRAMFHECLKFRYQKNIRIVLGYDVLITLLYLALFLYNPYGILVIVPIAACTMRSMSFKAEIIFATPNPPLVEKRSYKPWNYLKYL